MAVTTTQNAPASEAPALATVSGTSLDLPAAGETGQPQPAAGAFSGRQQETQMADTQGITGDQLKSYIERIERLEEEIGNLNQDKREVYSEAKANGFDKKAIQQVVKIRAQRSKDPQKYQEHNEIVDVYLSAIGDGSASGRAEVAPRTPTRDDWVARDKIFDGMAEAGQIKDTDTESTVYFVYAREVKRIKIGVTRDIDKRMSSFRTAIPCTLDLMATCGGGRQREMALHKQFAGARVQGEWFNATPELISFVHSLIDDGPARAGAREGDEEHAT